MAEVHGKKVDCDQCKGTGERTFCGTRRACEKCFGSGHVWAPPPWDALPEPPPDAAYARLIEAAPDLLEALEELVALTDRKHRVWDKARAALAKARTGAK